MRYYIIAGEASGDLHGSNLIRELRLLDQDATIRCWGGDKMESAGATLVKHFRDLAFMGFTEVLMNLGTILKNIRLCKQDIQSFKPDVLVLIDYPGFNLRIAKWAKEQGLKVIYYISPQVWAWKENRVKLIRKCVDKMLVILPFEKDFYRQWDYEVDYVGHPLVKVIQDFRAAHPFIKNDSGPKTIAILPGSRKQEIIKKLPVMLKVADLFPACEFVIAKAPGVEDDFYSGFTQAHPNVKAVSNQTYELLCRSSAAMVTSGTATLETALFKVPEVICYKGNNISYQIAKRLISIRYICLVNLIMDREVVKELIQDELTVHNLSSELDLLLNDPEKIQQLRQSYDELESLLSKGGNASANAASIIYGFLTSAAV